MVNADQMPGSNTRRTPWLTAIALGLALALLAPWPDGGASTGAAPRGSSTVAPADAGGHHAACPLVAVHSQPMLAHAPMALALQPGNAAECPHCPWKDSALGVRARGGAAAVAPQRSSPPLYLLSLHLRR